MRRAAVLAVVLVMALGGVAQAGPPVATVTGTYTYVPSGVGRTVTVDARTGPVTGTWSWTNLGTGMILSGSVTCLVVDGKDAWMAGPSTTSGLSVFLWVHDGGLPGGEGDMAVTWISDPGQSLKDMQVLCKQKSTTLTELFAVVSGDVIVSAAADTAGGAQVIHANLPCAVGWDAASWDVPSAGGCDVQNVMTPKGDYKLILHGQIPPDQMAAFIAAGSPRSFAAGCLVNYGFLYMAGFEGEFVFTDSVRDFTPDGKMTEVCEKSK
jgi:hypothetical protein